MMCKDDVHRLLRNCHAWGWRWSAVPSTRIEVSRPTPSPPGWNSSDACLVGNAVVDGVVCYRVLSSHQPQPLVWVARRNYSRP